MTKEDVLYILKAHINCLDCTIHSCCDDNCDDCAFNYAMGNLGEQLEAFIFAFNCVDKEES